MTSLNRLANSLSPYLLQHQNNPVDWFPWGDEAFELAIEEDKPVFLSVGYAACHWCHVMEHESFEDPFIANLLNQNFVSIKVDREERPDIDQVYMNAVQVMTGRGGWPMSVFLDHQRQPFFAGTYWPPRQKSGMPGFVDVLQSLSDAWAKRREEVLGHSGNITAALQQLAAGGGEQPDAVSLPNSSANTIPPSSLVTDACRNLLDVLDQKWGGFGGAPKFPHATDLGLLLRMGHVSADEAMVAAAELTLDRMAAGGIRDHIGGGFSRYSVDGQWLVPHFEKMLYDNALLAEMYVRAFQVTGHQRHAQVAQETPIMFVESWWILLADFTAVKMQTVKESKVNTTFGNRNRLSRFSVRKRRGISVLFMTSASVEILRAIASRICHRAFRPGPKRCQ